VKNVKVPGVMRMNELDAAGRSRLADLLAAQKAYLAEVPITILSMESDGQMRSNKVTLHFFPIVPSSTAAAASGDVNT
jgi:hypothetical protein